MQNYIINNQAVPLTKIIANNFNALIVYYFLLKIKIIKLFTTQEIENLGEEGWMDEVTSGILSIESICYTYLQSKLYRKKGYNSLVFCLCLYLYTNKFRVLRFLGQLHVGNKTNFSHLNRLRVFFFQISRRFWPFVGPTVTIQFTVDPKNSCVSN